MANDTPLLSICIPTYNRDYIISESLKRICPLAYKYDIPVYVSDNYSSDNTLDILRKYKDEYKNFDFARQERNIGSDKNTEYVLKMSNSRYRWLFGDTCAIEEQSLCLMLEELKKDDYDLLVCGGYGDRTKDMASEVFGDYNALLSKVGWHMTWLSCIVYSKEIINYANFYRFYDSRFLQMGIIFEYLAFNHCKVMVNPSIKLDALPITKKDHWVNITFEIFSKKWYLFIMSLPLSYTFAAKDKCIRDHGIKSKLFSIKSLLSLRKNNYFNLNTLIRYWFFIGQTVRINIIVLILVSIMPKFILSAAYKLRNLLRFSISLFRGWNNHG